jgi:hypothetical protein
VHDGKGKEKEVLCKSMHFKGKYLAKQQYLDDAISIELYYTNWILKFVLHGLII